MTKNSNLKKTVRARQADTGETYTEARRHLTGERRGAALWADADSNEFSPLAGARRAAANGIPVFILDDGSENSTYREVERFSPVVITDEDLTTKDFHPWECLQDPTRAARALSRLIHATVLADADGTKKASDEAVLRAAVSGESRQPLSRALALLGLADSEVLDFFASRGAECFAQLDAEPISLQARRPIVLRGALGALPVPRLGGTDADFESLKRERIIDVLTELHAELDGSSPSYALVFDGRLWFRAHFGHIDAEWNLDRDLTFPDKDVPGMPAELLAGFDGGDFRWSDLEGSPIVISGNSYRRQTQVLDRVINAALASGCATTAYLKPGAEQLQVGSLRSAEQFEAALIAIVTDRLVDGRIDRHQVVAISGLESLTEKVEQSPYPAASLPTAIRQKILERVADECAHNTRVEAILSLLDTLIRQGPELNLTVIISTSPPSGGSSRDAPPVGGKAPWALASAVRLWKDDAALRGSISTPKRNASVQFYV